MDFKEAIMEKAKQMRSVEELLALAEENSIEMTREQAQAYFIQLNPQSEELADDELDNVAGGACDSEKSYNPMTTY
jgi:hypothetical protein